jgi:hypothetical protein
VEVKYVEKGKPGKTCTECKSFKDKGDGKGDCFGYEVLAKGSCNLFAVK